MIDAAERARAAMGEGENLVVVAGAGSGKTSLLVERVLHQLVRRGLEIDALVAITFTEKAAAEMRERLAAALERLVALARLPEAERALDPTRAADRAWEGIAAALPPAEIGARAAARLHDLPRAAISTIHAWCAGVLRAFPLEAGVDPQFEVDEGPRYDALREELWHAWLEGPDRAGGARAALWARVLETLDLRELREIAFRLARFDLPEPLRAGDPDVCRRAHEAIAARGSAQIDALIRDPPAVGAESWLASARLALEALARGGIQDFRDAWDSLDFSTARDGMISIRARAGTSTKHPAATALCRALFRLFRSLARVDDAFAGDVYALLAPIAAAMRERARLRGVLPFDALLRLTRNLLLDRPEIRRALGARVEALLVDEFQDTDPLQYEIVFLLAEDPAGPPASDAWQTRLAPGKLFVVGDPKQAIYRFRGADLAAYHRATAHVEAQGGVRLALRTNFRSPPELLEPLGVLFADLLARGDDSLDPDERDASPGYDGLVSGRPSVGDRERVEVWTVGAPGTKRSVAAARRAEAAAIAQCIEGLIARGESEPREIAVLFRALGDAPLYLRALELRGVPCALDGGRDRLERPESRILVGLLRALANPADGPAVLAVLRSPLGGVPDVELARHAAAGGRWSYLDGVAEPEGCERLARAFRFLVEWRRAALALPLDALLAALAERSALFELVGLGPGGALRARNLRSLLDELAAIARADPELDAAGLEPWLDTLVRSRDVGRARTAPNAVRLMSVHAAKGLEFPVVFVPDLGRRRVDQGDWRVDPVRVGATRAGAFALGTLGPFSTGWVERERSDHIHGLEEDKRLFYVACTRAMERLFLVYAPCGGPTAASFVEYLAGWGYRPAGLPAGHPLAHPGAVVRQPLWASGAAGSTPAAAAPPAAALARTQAALTRARALTLPGFRSPSGLREASDARELESDAVEAPPRAAVPESPAQALARAVGVLVHEALERWDLRDARALRRLAREAALRAARRDALDARVLETEAEAIVEALLASDLPARLARADVIGREVPLVFRDADGTPWSGTIDLLYRDPDDGRLVIADWKTDRALDDAARARYRAQLETYARGVRLAFPEEPPPALELWLARLGRRERLGVESRA